MPALVPFPLTPSQGAGSVGVGGSVFWSIPSLHTAFTQDARGLACQEMGQPSLLNHGLRQVLGCAGHFPGVW